MRSRRSPGGVRQNKPIVFPNYRRRIRNYVVILALLAGVFLFMNVPQCPEHFTQEQVDTTRCIVGANIGLALYVLFAVPVLAVLLGLLGVALHKQYARSAADEDRHERGPLVNTRTDSHKERRRSMRQTQIIQRVEATAVALLAVGAIVVWYPAWWWVILAAFLVFDLSMLGYARSTTAGAASYNLVHNYAFPALVGLTALMTQSSFPAVSTAAGVLACAWAFHVGVDRALGYGLKMPDAFRHTHLGWIGGKTDPSTTNIPSN